ncbi:hypothetical protein [Nonomuraea jabiensis]|uniref:Uncharacterized protein n=1 Tax=Nonomuraea jabiensis TaxID=882448 RepID=A0A7W9LA31_9ACTN|nr:hypothetical protein [Nonomuraea jabiensis]MBB5776230.1 hypothetical protein [Nonomuraea jabiensis]
MDGNRMLARLGEIIRRSVEGLDAADRAERVAYCQRTGEHGVRVHAESEGVLVLTWGGKTLAAIERTVLTGDGPLPEPELIPAVPDDPRELTRPRGYVRVVGQRSFHRHDDELHLFAQNGTVIPESHWAFQHFGQRAPEAFQRISNEEAEQALANGEGVADLDPRALELRHLGTRYGRDRSRWPAHVRRRAEQLDDRGESGGVA